MVKLNIKSSQKLAEEWDAVIVEGKIAESCGIGSGFAEIREAQKGKTIMGKTIEL